MNQEIQGEYAIGIIADKNTNVSKLNALFKVEITEEVDGDNTYEKRIVRFEENEIKVYIVADSKETLDKFSFPVSGALAGSISNPEERLIQLMEENGSNQYKIIK